MVYEVRKQSMASMETDYLKHIYMHFRWKIKWQLETTPLTLSLPGVINFNFLLQSLTRDISYSMENSAFDSLLRWKLTGLSILTTPLNTFVLERLGEFVSWDWYQAVLTHHLSQDMSVCWRIHYGCLATSGLLRSHCLRNNNCRKPNQKQIMKEHNADHWISALGI